MPPQCLSSLEYFVIGLKFVFLYLFLYFMFLELDASDVSMFSKTFESVLALMKGTNNLYIYDKQ